MTTRLLEGLNPAQRKAVEQIDGPLLIVAGPGSGKTRVIVHRIAYLVNTVDISPGRICAVTFTNRAARQLKERLAELLGPDRGSRVAAGTFHALCARLLRQHGDVLGLDQSFTIYDLDDQVSLLKEAFAQIDLDPKRFSLRGVLDGISGAKAQLRDPEAYRGQSRELLRGGGRSGLRGLPAAAGPQPGRGLRRPAHADLPAPSRPRRCPRAVPGALPPPARRRVPGHEPGTVRHRQAAGGSLGEHLRGGRPGPVDLHLAPRGYSEHSELPAGLPQGARRDAGRRTTAPARTSWTRPRASSPPTASAWRSACWLGSRRVSRWW